MAELAPGVRLGTYEIEAPLGRGGMGEVYRAKDLKLGRAVAVKILHGDFDADPERLRRFEQEARAASALNHPHIVHIYDIGGAASDTHYIVMELVEGRTLREILSGAPLTSDRISEIGRQIADGLAKAHSAGIVHRDVKPENVMVSDDDFAKILDFGLAKLVTLPFEMHPEMATLAREGTRHGTLLGTVEYMSPEQAAGRAVDHRSDQFSLGLILYEMATGRLAFRRETAAQTLAAIIEGEPRPIAELNPSAPAALEAIVRRCLRKNPEERYADTRDLVRDLRALGGKGAVPSREAPPPEPARPPPPPPPSGGIAIYVDDDDASDVLDDGAYHLRTERGERLVSEARLRKLLRRNRYSGMEMVRREGEAVFRPLRETEIYARVVGDRDRRKLFELGKHLVVFVSVGAGFTIAEGGAPSWLGFWGIGVAVHTFSTLPALWSVMQKRSRRAEEAIPVPAAAPVPVPVPVPAPVPELVSGSFREEAARVRKLLERRGGEGVSELVTEIDGILARVAEIGAMQRDLKEQTSAEERARLRGAEKEARERLEQATSAADRELHRRHLEVVRQRLAAIDKALAVIERLDIRREMAEHQLKQLRLDLSRGEASSASAPQLSSRLQDIRHEVDAVERVDEAIAKELLN